MRISDWSSDVCSSDLDVHEFASKGEGLGDFLREVTAWLQMAVGALIRLDAVVVAEVQGFAAGGGGLGLVCASDVVIAGEGAKFLAGGTRVGMAPDGGASARSAERRGGEEGVCT